MTEEKEAKTNTSTHEAEFASSYLETISGGQVRTEEPQGKEPSLPEAEIDRNFARHRGFEKLLMNMKKRYGRARDELENVKGDEILGKQAEAKALRAIIQELESMQGKKHGTQQQNGRVPSRLKRMVGAG